MAWPRRRRSPRWPRAAPPGPVRETGQRRGGGDRAAKGAEISTIELYHQVDGPAGAPTLLLLGPLGGTGELWAAQVPALAGRFRVVRADHRGHGRSPVPPGPYRLDELAGDVLALLDRLGAQRCHLAGLSLGGMVGLWLAQHAPERLDRLALLCTSARLGPPQMWADRAAIVLAEGTDAVAETAIGRWFTPGYAAAEPERVAAIRAMIAATPPVGYAGCCAAIETMDLRPALGVVRAPTLVVAGTDDPSTTPEHLRLIADGIPGSRYVQLDDCAHVAIVEQAGPVTELLLEHFAG
jgi:3-oxoadipate enol-lactonase